MALDADSQRRLLCRARDADLSREARQEALGALLDDFRRPAMAAMQRVLSSVGAGPEHADEAWSRAVFKFYTRGLTAFEGRANAPTRRGAAPRSYFVRLAINAAVDVCRQLARAQRGEGSPGAEVAGQAPPGLSASAQTPAEAYAAKEELTQQWREIEALRACVESLPENYGAPVTLYYLEQLGSCERCAEELEISKSSFMQRLSRARRKLAACVEARLAEGQEGDHGRS